jgi:hypothetical protein
MTTSVTAYFVAAVWPEDVNGPGYSILDISGHVSWASKAVYKPEDNQVFAYFDTLIPEKALLEWELELAIKRVHAVDAYLQTKHCDKQSSATRQWLKVHLHNLFEHANALGRRGQSIVNLAHLKA